jgi:hypothetical protein
MKYRIRQYEVHSIAYEVEAENAAEAIQMVVNGKVAPVDDSGEFHEVDTDRGLSLDDVSDDIVTEADGEALRKSGEALKDWGIPSIHSIEKIG